MELITNLLGRFHPRIVAVLEKYLRAIPAVNKLIENEFDDVMGDLEEELKPYKNEFVTQARLPETGRAREAIIDEMESLKSKEEARWKETWQVGQSYDSCPCSEIIESCDSRYAHAWLGVEVGRTMGGTWIFVGTATRAWPS